MSSGLYNLQLSGLHDWAAVQCITCINLDLEGISSSYLWSSTFKLDAFSSSSCLKILQPETAFSKAQTLSYLILDQPDGDIDTCCGHRRIIRKLGTRVQKIADVDILVESRGSHGDFPPFDPFVERSLHGMARIASTDAGPTSK